MLTSKLASIHIEHPTKVNLLPSGATSTTATTTTATPTSSSGRISIRGNTESYLSLTWSSVNSTEEGIYSCVAQGLDNLGHLVTMTSSSLVKRGSDLERFKLSLDKVRQTLEQSQTCCVSLQQRLASLEWTFQRLTLALRHIERSLVLAHFEEYMTQKYYTSKYAVKEFITGKAVCEVLGGYLAEISDSGENKAVETILKAATPKLSAYYLGAQDAAKEGDWRWIRNNTKLTYNAWPPSEPNNFGDEDCLEWWNGRGWNDIRCSHSRATKGFLCEV